MREKESTVVRSVNACLVPVLSCDEWDITTVEGVGGRRAGMDDVQSRSEEEPLQLFYFHGCGNNTDMGFTLFAWAETSL